MSLTPAKIASAPATRRLLRMALLTAFVLAFPLLLAVWQVRDNRDQRRPAFDPDLAALLVSRLQSFAASDPDWWKRDEAAHLLAVLGKRAAPLKPELERATPLTLEDRRKLNKLLDLIK